MAKKKKSISFYVKALQSLKEKGKTYSFSNRKKRLSPGQKSAITREFNKSLLHKRSTFIPVKRKRGQSKTAYEKELKEIRQKYGQKHLLKGVYAPNVHSKAKEKGHMYFNRESQTIHSKYSVNEEKEEIRKFVQVGVDKVKLVKSKKERSEYLRQLVNENLERKTKGKKDRVTVNVIYGSGIVQGFTLNSEEDIQKFIDDVNNKVKEYKVKSLDLFNGLVFQYNEFL